MKTATYALLTALMLTVSACDHKDEQADTTPSATAASNQPASTASADTKAVAPAQGTPAEADGFSIVPPTGWTKGEAKDKTIMVYLAPAENNFRPNFNVNTSPDDGTPIDKVGTLIKPVFAKQFEKWKAMDEGTLDINGENAYYISSRFSMQGKEIRNLQYYIRGKSKKFYVLTFTALEAGYPALESTFKATAASVTTK